MKKVLIVFAMLLPQLALADHSLLDAVEMSTEVMAAVEGLQRTNKVRCDLANSNQASGDAYEEGGIRIMTSTQIARCKPSGSIRVSYKQAQQWTGPESDEVLVSEVWTITEASYQK